MSTNIEWTHGLKTPTGELMAGKTWNPLAGCSEKSRGCLNCYAARMSWRLMHNPKTNKDYEGIAKKLPNGRIVFTGKINLLSDRLSEPINTKKPTVYFVNSMSDLFHEDVPFEFVDQVFAVMALCQQHIFQVLTKRPERMLQYLSQKDLQTHIELAGMNLVDFGVHVMYVDLPLSNIWLGTSVEDQKAADQRREPLRVISELGWLTWVSNEPCVGPIDWKGWEFLKWMVTGGESGPGADPMHPSWARVARDFCAENKMPFFFKQHGSWVSWKPEYSAANVIYLSAMDGARGTNNIYVMRNGKQVVVSDAEPMVKVGKHAAGRVLDGRTYDEYPALFAVREQKTVNS